MSALWHGVIAVLLIVIFFSAAGLAAYELYGPGIRFELPDYLLPAGWATTTAKTSANNPLAEYTGTLFACEGGKTMKVEFIDDAINLALSDGRRVRLTQVAADDGARYANTDGSFVFWTKGITATVEEQGAQTYASCLQN